MAQKKTTETNQRRQAPAQRQGAQSAGAKKKGAVHTNDKDQMRIKEKDKKPRSDKLVHQILPFVWFFVALFLALCIILRDIFMLRGADNWFGPVGEGVHALMFGLFGWGAFLIPALFVYLGIMWRKLIDEKKLTAKLIFASLLILLVSALAQVFVSNDVYPAFELWNSGADIVGGGLIGGSLGWLSYAGLKIAGSIIVIIALIIIFGCLFFEVTPRNIWTWIRYKNKVRKEKKERERLARLDEQERLQKEQEQNEYYDDEDEISEDEDDLDDEMIVADEAENEPEPEEKGRFGIIKRREAKEEKSEEPEEIEDEAPEEPVKEEKLLDKIFVDNTVSPQIHANDEDDGAEPTESEDDEPFVTTEPEPEATVIPWVQPPLDLLNPDPGAHADQSDNIAETKAKLRQTLESFGVRIKDIGYSIGPTITRYEVFPEAGVRVKQIANLVDDIAMSLATVGVRIEAPIPNKPAVGVEVPNEIRSNVYLKTLIDDDQFWNSSPLTVCLGQDVAGKNVYFDIKKMPHMIIAGTTGSGKSVCINSIVTSLLYKNPADKVKLIMIDPKKVEFTMYQHIPHLYCPIISDPRKAAGALASAVTEMERRYTLVEDVGVRDVDSYNKATANDPDREYLPKLIIIIDELADLMMTAKADVELFITRIAQKARAVGIHLILGTQRPSVDVITGLIKANVPSRIACTVKSQVDSRTIIDISGAEKLIGRGDMLYSPVGLSKPMRVQGAFLEDDEVRRVVDFIKDNNEPVSYNRAFMDNMDAAAANMEAEGKKGGGSDFTPADGGGDDKFRQALEVAVNEGKISTSLLQRKLSIGYGKAAKIIDEMEEAGYVSAPDGNKPRRVLISKQEFYEKALNDELPTSNE